MDKYIGRIVALVLGPIIIGATAWFSVWAAENLPGAPNIPAKELGEIAVAGAVAAGLGIHKWLDNRGQHERAAGVR